MVAADTQIERVHIEKGGVDLHMVAALDRCPWSLHTVAADTKVEREALGLREVTIPFKDLFDKASDSVLRYP